jgi:hypothetical protein
VTTLILLLLALDQSRGLLCGVQGSSSGLSSSHKVGDRVLVTTLIITAAGSGPVWWATVSLYYGAFYMEVIFIHEQHATGACSSCNGSGGVCMHRGSAPAAVGLCACPDWISYFIIIMLPINGISYLVWLRVLIWCMHLLLGPAVSHLHVVGLYTPQQSNMCCCCGGQAKLTLEIVSLLCCTSSGVQ